jgi:glycerate dehydrogenase
MTAFPRLLAAAAALFLVTLAPSPAVAAANAPRIVLLSAADYIGPDTLQALRALGSLEVFSGTDTEDKVVQRLKGADIAIADPFQAPLNAAALSRTAGLKLLVLTATGTDGVDVATAARRGIRVANTPDYGTESVAEHSFALLLAVSRKVTVGDVAMRRAPFEANGSNPDFRYLKGFELEGRTLGVVGYGRIGKRVAQIGQGFGMRILAWDRNPVSDAGVTQVELERLLQDSDVVSLHLPLTPATAKIIDAPRLALMKKSAVLINTARGGLVDEPALTRALQSRQIAAAGLDVIADVSAGNPLVKLDNVVLTPHTAFYSEESLRKRAATIVATVRAYIDGKPINLVEPTP